MQQLPMEAAVLIALTVTFWVLLLLCPPFCESVIGFLDKHSMALRSGWAAYVRHWRRPSAEAAARLDTVLAQLDAKAMRAQAPWWEPGQAAELPNSTDFIYPAGIAARAKAHTPQADVDSGLWSCR